MWAMHHDRVTKTQTHPTNQHCLNSLCSDTVSGAPAKRIRLDADDEEKRLVVDIGDNMVNPEEVGGTDSVALP